MADPLTSGMRQKPTFAAAAMFPKAESRLAAEAAMYGEEP